MSVRTKLPLTRAEKHKLLRKKIGKPKFKSNREMIQNAGLWKDRKDLTAKKLREQAWNRN